MVGDFPGTTHYGTCGIERGKVARYNVLEWGGGQKEGEGSLGPLRFTTVKLTQASPTKFWMFTRGGRRE